MTHDVGVNFFSQGVERRLAYVFLVHSGLDNEAEILLKL